MLRPQSAICSGILSNPMRNKSRILSSGTFICLTNESYVASVVCDQLPKSVVEAWFSVHDSFLNDTLLGHLSVILHFVVSLY